MPARLAAPASAQQPFVLIQHPTPIAPGSASASARWPLARLPALAAALAAALAVAAPTASWSQTYSNRPLRIVVGFSPGGAPDLVARQLSEALSGRFGQSVVVDNRPGANGVIGADIVSKANPDGHTVLVTSASFAINPSIYRKLPYDPIAGFAPVTNIALGGGLILCVNAASPYRSVRELIAMAKKPGAKLSYGSAGIGNATHLTAALFNHRAGTQMTHVPYKGAGQAIAALLGSEVQILFTSTASSLRYIEAGRLRALAYNHGKRNPALPDVPTMEEAGVAGTVLEGSWYGVFAPPQTAPAVVVALQQAIAEAVRQPAVRERLATLALEPDGRPPEEFKSFVERSIAGYRELVKIAEIEPQ